VAYNRLNVKLAAGYAGLSDFADGASHQSVFDLAVMRAMPEMTVLVPSDLESTRGAVRAMLRHNGPVYLRLSRDSVGSCHEGDESFDIGKAIVLKEGSDITLAVCGTLLPQTLRAAEELEKDGVSAAVLEFPTLKPFDSGALLEYAERTRAVVSVEEHSVIGGLGGAIAEALTGASPVGLQRVGIPDTFAESGAYGALLEKYGLSVSNIVKAAHDILGRGRTAINKGI
jgi:transketolase